MSKEKKTITRRDLADRLFSQIGLSRSESAELVDEVFDRIGSALVEEDAAKLPDFGTFKARMSKRRIGRNPKTGEEVTIESRRTVRFRSSPKLKKVIDEGMKQNFGIPKT